MVDWKTRSSLLLTALLAGSTPALADDGTGAEPTPAEEHPPDLTQTSESGVSFHYLVETGVATTYVFRGIPQYLEKTDPSSQTTLTLTFQDLGPGALSVGVWNATSIASYGSQPATKLELDLTAGYTMNLTDSLSAGVGYIGYFYPEADPVDGAHEIYGTLTLANDLVTPTLGVFAELVRLEGVYAILGLARTFTVGKLAIVPGVSAAVSGYEGQDFGLNDLGARVLGSWTASSGFYAGASVNYSYNAVPEDGSFGDRSTFWAMAFVGFSR